MLKLSLLLLIFSSFITHANSLLLSGELQAADNQTFYSPKSDSWRIQVQWLMPEGDIAKQGDVVVVFDSGSIASTIEQDEVALEAAKEELIRITNQNEEALLEATFNYKRTDLLLQRARIDAAIPKANLSTYDYEKNQLELEKALINKQKSAQELTQTKTSNSVALQKQQLNISQLEQDIAFNTQRLNSMSIKAKRAGPVLYAKHPWNGQKVFVGMTAQAGWKIAEIPALNGLYIEAWVHEVDFHKLALGDQVELVFDAYANQPIEATLVDISTQPQEQQQWGKDAYFRTRFNFTPPPALSLLPGMSAKLTLGAEHE